MYKCIYPNNLDGKICAGIIARHTGNSEEDSICIDNIKDEYNIDIESLKDSVVYIVGCICAEYITTKIESVAKQIIWIDYHLNIYNPIHLDGIRYSSEDNPKSACLLLWEYLYPNKDIPYFIKCFSEYIINNTETREYELGDKANICINNNFNTVMEYRDLIKQLVYNAEMIITLANTGTVIKASQEFNYRNLIKNSSFEFTLFDKSILVLNHGNKSIDIFGDTINDYDFVCIYNMNCNKEYYYSFYTTRDDIDLSSLIKIIGGSGDEKFASCVLDYNLFDDKNKDAVEMLSINNNIIMSRDDILELSNIESSLANVMNKVSNIMKGKR